VAARLLPGLVSASPYATEIGLARRPGAASGEVSRLERARDETCRQQALGLIARACSGDVQAAFRVLPQDVARDLAGPAAVWTAYLADVEDYPDER
jgi:hypothetical protein